MSEKQSYAITTAKKSSSSDAAIYAPQINALD